MTFLWHGLTDQGAQVPVQVDAQGRVVISPDAAPNPNELVAAWASVEPNGTVTGQFNVASVVFSAPNRFDVTFTSPMADTNYAVVTGSETGWSAYVNTSTKQTTGFSYVTRATATGSDVQGNCNFIVCGATS